MEVDCSEVFGPQVTHLDAKVKDFKDRLPDDFFVDERLSYRNLIGILNEKEKLTFEIENMKHPVSGDQLDELRKISKSLEESEAKNRWVGRSNWNGMLNTSTK